MSNPENPSEMVNGAYDLAGIREQPKPEQIIAIQESIAPAPGAEVIPVSVQRVEKETAREEKLRQVRMDLTDLP